MKRLITAIAFIFGLAATAQETTEKSATPLNDTQVPGSLVVDFGFNILGNDKEDVFDLGIFGSKAFRIGYQYELPIDKSGFTFNPGIAISIEKYGFSGTSTLSQLANGTVLDTIKVLSLPLTDVTKSLFSTTYLDIPLELRWHLNKSNFQKSFKVAVGAKIGMRVGSQTKVKYTDPITGNDRIIKDKQTYDLRRFRYGAYGKVGVGSFSLYYYQSLSELFEKEKGPSKTQATPFQIGLTYEIF